jgi:hypothetical protein
MPIEWDGTEYRAWHSPEEKAALLAYYRDPIIEWFEGGTEAYGGPLPANGFYVMPHCGHIECCRPDGPFESEQEARTWAVKNFETVKREIKKYSRPQSN